MTKRRFILSLFSGLLIFSLLCSSAFAVGSLRDTPYTLSIPGGTPIYAGPGTSYGRAGSVDEDGVYTIVEQRSDEAGTLWGRLKSGAGWLRLNISAAADFSAPSSGKALPYTVSLSADTPIYSRPDDGFAPVSYVGEKGIYTITEERCDASGSLWGKLKSGAGWVCLHHAQLPSHETPPYSLALSASAALYNGPGYDSGFRGLLDYDGVYTVYEEVCDWEGFIWGRLDTKGQLWINLSEHRQVKPHSPIDISFADAQLLESGNFVFFDGSKSGYPSKLAFRANEDLHDLYLAELEPGSFEPKELLCHIPSLSQTSAFVAALDFPGDLSSYAVYFTDSTGSHRLFEIYLSGRDGSLISEDMTDHLSSPA